MILLKASTTRAEAGMRTLSTTEQRWAPAGFLVFMLATALAMIVTYPLALHFGDEIYGTPGDATGAVSQFWWWGYALAHGQPIFDNALQGVPLGSGWSELPFVVLPVLVFTPLSAMIGPIASYNILVLSGFPLTAWAVYLLGRRLRLPAVSAAFAGLAFAFSPYHVEKAQGHAYQTHLEFAALTLFFLVAWRDSKDWKRLVAAGAMLGLQFWMDYSLTYVLSIGLVAFAAAHVLIRPREVRWHRWLVSNLAAGALVAATASLFVPVGILFAHRPGSGSYGQTFGGALGNVVRNLNELVVYSARLREYLEPWHSNPLLPGAIRDWEQAHLHGSNFTESSLFLGYTVILMAGLGVLVRGALFHKISALFMMAAGLAMAEPPTVHVLGHDVHAPSFYAFQFITFFRVYARFAVLVMLGSVLLAGLAMSRLEGSLGSGRRRFLLAIPFVLLAVEFNNQPPSHVTRLLPAPAAYVWLRDQPQGILLEYPANSGSPQDQEIEIRQYELYQMIHLHPTFLNEITGSGPVADAAAQLEPYYRSGVVGQIRGYGIRYVFVHRADYTRAGWDLPQSVDGMTLVKSLGGIDIWLVNSGP